MSAYDAQIMFAFTQIIYEANLSTRCGYGVRIPNMGIQNPYTKLYNILLDNRACGRINKIKWVAYSSYPRCPTYMWMQHRYLNVQTKTTTTIDQIENLIIKF